jgi:hypothetical protein
MVWRCSISISARVPLRAPANKGSRRDRQLPPVLERELALLDRVQGSWPWGRSPSTTPCVFTARPGTLSRLDFAHGVLHHLGDNLPWLLASYHPSLQNTQTGRLTEEMFDEIWERARSLLT